jgi:sugar O-acyltransferase (sialic acid O-acetyltransferase NeuD family)
MTNGNMDKTTNYILWGSSGHAIVLGSLLTSINGRIIALFDQNPQAKSVIDNASLYIGKEGFLNWLETRRSNDEIFGLAAIGGARGRDRLQIQMMFMDHNIKVPTVVHPRAYVCHTATLSPGTQVLANAVIGSAARIESACIINHGAQVDHECLVSSGSHVAPGAILCGCVEVGSFVLIGAGAVVLPRVKIGENSIIGAGAVVTKNIPGNCIAVGNPARIVKRIDT